MTMMQLWMLIEYTWPTTEGKNVSVIMLSVNAMKTCLVSKMTITISGTDAERKE